MGVRCFRVSDLQGILSLGPLSELSQASSNQPAGGGAPGAPGRAHRWNCCADLPKRGIGPSVPRRFRATSYLVIARVRRCERQRDIVGPVIPTYNPEARRVAQISVVRWPSAQPWHGPRPRGLGPRPRPQPRRTADLVLGRNATRLQQVSACSVLGPLPIRIPPPLATLLGLQRAKPPPATWRGRSQSGTRGSWGRGAGPPPQTPGRRGQTPGWKKREGQRAKALACGHRKEGAGDSAGGGGRAARGSGRPGGLGPPGCLCHIPPTRDPRMASLPRSASSAPAFRTRHRCPQFSKPQKSKFPFEDLDSCGRILQFPTPDPSAPVPENQRQGPWRWPAEG